MTRLLITLLLLCTMGAKAQTSQTLADFNARKAVLTHGHLFDIFSRHMTDDERDAIRKEIPVSLYNDFRVSVEEIFEDVDV